jgi:hypothetical protein
MNFEILPTDVISIFNLEAYDILIAVIQSPTGKYRGIDVTYLL